jgi:hypothetical protein
MMVNFYQTKYHLTQMTYIQSLTTVRTSKFVSHNVTFSTASYDNKKKSKFYTTTIKNTVKKKIPQIFKPYLLII